jgi:lipid II:glycine glycyltransferase (peptidoglycan interpeptide bridge formation enzyme)
MATIFQTPEWEKFKLKTGWQKSWRVFDILVLEKKIPLLGSMLYAPVANRDQTKLATQKIFLDKIFEIAKESKAFLFRLESGESNDSDINPMKAGYIKAFEEMQPEHTFLIDLLKTEGDILKEMKPKGRYNIRVAEKHGVKISSQGKINNFYQLYQKMAKRQKITYRKMDYFQKLLDLLGKKDYVQVFEARSKENKLLASAIIVFYQDTATYLFGGSSDEDRQLMAPYKLHLETIREAKNRGCRYYDMFGIAPNDDPKHPWAGVTRFKRQFGGQEFIALGSWDKVYSPIKYFLFKLAEKIRR